MLLWLPSCSSAQPLCGRRKTLHGPTPVIRPALAIVIIVEAAAAVPEEAIAEIVPHARRPCCPAYAPQTVVITGPLTLPVLAALATRNCTPFRVIRPAAAALLLLSCSGSSPRGMDAIHVADAGAGALVPQNSSTLPGPVVAHTLTGRSPA